MLRTFGNGDIALRCLGDALDHAKRTAGLARRRDRIDQGRYTLPTRATLREVSLQDARHSFACGMSTASKCDWILLAYAAGLRHIAVGDYAPSNRLRQPDDTPEVVAFAATLPDLQTAVTIRDVDCAHRAFDHGASVVTVPLVLGSRHAAARAQTHGERLPKELRAVCRARDAAGTGSLVEARIGVPLGGPDTRQGESSARALVRTALDAGCDAISVADTSGHADPAQVLHLFGEVRAMVEATPVSAHLHGGGEPGFAAALAALQAGATMLDLTLAGGSLRDHAGASPCGVAAMLATRGVGTGVDLRTLGELRNFAARHAARSARP